MKKKINFFSTAPLIFTENLISVFDQIYDRYVNKFYKVSHLNVLSKKVDFINKEISYQKKDYSYVFTISTKAKEIMDEYLLFRS